MAATTFSSATRINVSNTTDLIHQRVEDVDCTDTLFDAPPEDGQFVSAFGPIASNPCADSFIGETNFADLGAGAPALAIVWSGGAQRADGQALGYKRVPLIRAAVRVRLKMFNLSSDNGTTPPSTDYPVGTLVGVAKAAAAVKGSSNRLVANPILATDIAAKGAWAVGYVTRIMNDSPVAGQAEIEIQLYDFPRYIASKA